MTAGNVLHFLPERGETITDARPLLGVWAKEECGTLDLSPSVTAVSQGKLELEVA